MCCQSRLLLATATIFSFTIISIFGSNPGDRIDIDGRTKFRIYDDNNEETSSRHCSKFKRYAMIVHGYQESCNTFWVKELRKNLIEHRGGCIICMDYSAYNDDYRFLILKFKSIAKVLKNKLVELRDKSFSSNRAYLFGFSYGSRLISRAVIKFGPKQIGTIHLCDPAGPGFRRSNTEPRLAAQNSQCIHTDSKNHGTEDRMCHQDWHLGMCGECQIAAGPKPLGSHGLCPVFYNYAFKYKFMAVKKSKVCDRPISMRDLQDLPSDGIRMGYFQTIPNSSRFSEVNLYANTNADPPYV